MFNSNNRGNSKLLMNAKAAKRKTISFLTYLFSAHYFLYAF